MSMKISQRFHRQQNQRQLVDGGSGSCGRFDERTKDGAICVVESGMGLGLAELALFGTSHELACLRWDSWDCGRGKTLGVPVDSHAFHRKISPGKELRMAFCLYLLNKLTSCPGI